MSRWAVFPGDDERVCCMGAAVVDSCTCWEPVYSHKQQAPRTDLEQQTRRVMCPGCAYRTDSPEQSDHEDAGADMGDLIDIAVSGEFACHQGMRRITGWRHPDGAYYEHPGQYLDYQPPIVDGVPYKADGTPACRCAGWAAMREALHKETQ